MADTEKKLVQAKDEFQSKQLEPIEGLKTAEGNDINLDSAKGIGLIEAETAEKIRNLSGKFKETYEREKRNKSDTEALKAAFGAVYMPPLLREKSALEEPDSKAMNKLRKVLKFPIQEKLLWKDRPEIKAVARQLIFFNESHKNDANPIDVLDVAFGGVNPIEYQKAQKEVKDAKKKFKQTEEAEEYFSNDDTARDYTAAIQRFDKQSSDKKENVMNIEISQLERQIKGWEDVLNNRHEGRLVLEDEVKRGTMETDIIENTKKIKELETLLNSAKKLHGLFVARAKHLLTLVESEIINPSHKNEIDGIISNLSASEPTDARFKAQDLIDVKKRIDDFNLLITPNLTGQFHDKLPELKGELEKAERNFSVLDSNKKMVKNLTDAQAAKKIITVMLNEQFPDMSLEDQQKVATLILAEDVATIQNSDNYSEFAKKANAETMPALNLANAREYLIGMRFKIDGKFVHPFKGFKPKDFADWDSIEKLFKIGKLNHQNGFLAYAALKNIEHPDVPSIQTIKMEKKLKELLADELGVKDRMDEAGISRIIDKAFEEQLEKITPLVTDFSAKYNEKRGDWDTFKTQEFKNKFKALAEERRLGKMSDEIYQKRYNELSEEALEAGVDNRFGLSQNAALSSFYHNKYMQWGRDRGVDAGRWAKEKAKGLAMSGLRIGWRAGWGSVKLGANIGWQAALTPFRLLKYPFKLLGQPLRLFMKKPWAPLEIRNSVRNDFGRVLNYSKGLGKGVWEGTKGAAGVIPEEWKKREGTWVEYSKRTKVNNETLKKEAEELELKANEEVAVEVASIPYIKLDKYKTQIDQLNKIISQGGSAEAAAA